MSNKIAIIGSRTATEASYNELKTLMDTLNPTVIISGGAKGADKLGERYAKERNLPIELFYPDWQNKGKVAGLLRNTAIVETSDIVVAIWDGVSRGTYDSIKKARALNKEIYIIPL